MVLRPNEARPPRRALPNVLALGLAWLGWATLAPLPSCGNDACPGSTEVCLADGTTCVCAAKCSHMADCDAADPTTRRYCFINDDGDGGCVPASFFSKTCSGQRCEGGLCSASGVCEPLCRHSSECASGCCSEVGVPGAANAVCVPPTTSGGTYSPGTCKP
jgi:hypothetical protein